MFKRLFVAGALAAPALASGATELSTFGEGWELKGKAAVESRDGRTALAVESGFAYARGVSFQDGTIEFEVQLTRRRSFVYLMFRMQGDGEYEEIYLRPHKSGLPDALQYAPVYQGHSAWQLHHGPGGTAAVPFEPGAWTRVRLVVQGRRAALFVGDMSKPALEMPSLRREPRAGYIALRGFLPADEPGQGPIARFANLSLRPGDQAFDLRTLKDEPAPAATGVVARWSVSRAFVPAERSGIPALPPAETLGEFKEVAAEPSGLVELHREVPLPQGSRRAAAVARLELRAARPGVRAFEIGWSDVAVVFLNGRPIFRSDASYSYDTPRREGLIGFDQATVYLPLEAGANQLAVLVSDGFGGWGLMGRFPDPSGLEVAAR